MDMSSAFLTVLDAERKGASYFDELTLGKKRTLIHWVDQVRSEDIRIRRALVLVQHLVAQRWAVDFKRLNAMIKAENQKHKNR